MRAVTGLVLLLLFSVVPFAGADEVFNGNTSGRGGSALPHVDTLAFPHVNGSRLYAVEHLMPLSPQTSGNQLNVSANSHTFLNASTEHITFGNGTVNIEDYVKIPGAGNTSVNVTSAVNWSGDMSFDRVTLKCLPGASCGVINVYEELILRVNILVIEQGTRINAANMVWNGTGRGIDGFSSDFPGEAGGSGAGHRGYGGMPGGGNGTGGLYRPGGIPYGWGDEKGSSGGNVTSPLITNQNTGHGTPRPHNLSSLAGAGGGKVVILARSVIVDGGIDARGGRGENGPSQPSGHGNGLHGAGGGSGGSIHIVANTVGIGPFGYVKADGGGGGSGGRGSSMGFPPTNFNGGNGGGGGSGGYVTIATKPGQLFANPLSITAWAGGGGLRGSPSASGNYGLNGTGGGWGHVTTSVFQGWGPMAQVPDSGYGVIDIQNTVFLQGNLSLLLVRLSCNNVTCGNIIATGPLNISAVTVILENGTTMASVWGATSTARGGDGFNNDTSFSDAGHAAGGGGSYMGDGGGGGQSNPKTNAVNGALAHGNQYLDAGKGGDVYENGALFSNGGLGGGQIRIWAGTIIVNGTMTASGTDGEDPARPSTGSRAGRNGAGGGGGGLISLQANRIEVTGSILARGGDGGDGTLPYRSMNYMGCCVGGNGGGGGGGGAITINTTTANFHSTGLVDESAGMAGQAGAHAYSLIGTGEPGSAGGNGQYSSTTFAGYPIPPMYPWTGNLTLANITLADGRVVDDLYLQIDSSTPQYTDIDVFVRSSLDNITWQPWSEINLNTGLMPRAAHLQIKFILISHDGWTTPTLRGYHLDWNESDPVDRLLLESDWNDVMLFTLDGADDGTGLKPLLTVQDNASVNDVGSFSLLFPSGAVPIRSGLVWSIDGLRDATWCDVVVTGPNGSIQFSTARIDRGPHGTDFHLDANQIASVMERNSSSVSHVDSEGIEWSTLWVNWTHSLQNTPAKVTHLRLTYDIVLDLGGLSDLSSVINARVLNLCGTMASATTDCIPEHIAVIKGQRLRGTSGISVGRLNPIWIDDVAPEVTTSTLSASRTSFQPFEVNDEITLSVKVIRDEPDLVAEAWVFPNELDHITEPPGTAPDLLTWNATDSAYVGLLTIPGEYALNESHSPRVALRLTDSLGNSFYDGDHIDLELGPAKPNIATVSLTGRSLEEGFAHDTPIDITVNDISGRDDFTFTLYLSRNDDLWTSELVDLGGGLHQTTFHPNRSSIGDWNVLITAKDATSGVSHYPAVPPTVVQVRDGIEPMIISTEMNDRNVWEDLLSVQVAWSAELDEQVWIRIDVIDINEDSVLNSSINATGTGEGILEMNLAQLTDGNYSLIASISDSSGNTDVEESGTVILNRTAVMTIDLTRSVTDTIDDGTVRVVLNVTCTPACALTLNDQDGQSHLDPWIGGELNTEIEITVPYEGLRIVATATYEDNMIQMHLDLPEWEEPLGGFETNLTTTNRGESGTNTSGNVNTTEASNAAASVTGESGSAIDGRLVIFIVAVAILAVLTILVLVGSGLISRLPEKAGVNDPVVESNDESGVGFESEEERDEETGAFSGPPIQNKPFSGPPVQNELFSGPPAADSVAEEPVEPIEVSEALGIIGQSAEVATKLPVEWEKLPPGGGYDRDDEGVLWYSVPGQADAWKQSSDGQFEHVPTGRSDS